MRSFLAQNKGMFPSGKLYTVPMRFPVDRTVEVRNSVENFVKSESRKIEDRKNASETINTGLLCSYLGNLVKNCFPGEKVLTVLYDKSEIKGKLENNKVVVSTFHSIQYYPKS